MATLSDISKQLGVSVATVSNALTGKGRMREELRQEIITAASDMGYAPTGNARLPVTENIIVIAEDISVSFCADIVGEFFRTRSARTNRFRSTACARLKDACPSPMKKPSKSR